MKATAYFKVNDTLTLIFDTGDSLQIAQDDRRYNDALALIKNNDLEGAGDLLTAPITPETFFEGTPVSVKDGKVFINDAEVESNATKYFLDLLNEGLPTTGIPEFLARLEANPSYRVREQLFGFLVQGKNKILSNGNFLAYKRVRDDYTDVHTGKFDNSPGKPVSVDRRDVDDDPMRVCSSGLHVCSYEYLSSFSGARVIEVEVHPADVVCVPIDYNHTKMRTCGYYVRADITDTYMNDPLRATYENQYDIVDLLEEGTTVWSPEYGEGNVLFVNSQDEAVVVNYSEECLYYTFQDIRDDQPFELV